MITKKELIQQTVATTKYTPEEVSYVVGAFLDCLSSNIKKGNEITLNGVIHIYPTTVKAFRSNLNPQYMIQEHTCMKAKVAPVLNQKFKRSVKDF